jgi:hypothetical protein
LGLNHESSSMRFLLLILSLLILTSCARQVSRIDPSQQIDLSGRWNDSDSRQVAEKMTAELLNSTTFKDYANTLGKKASYYCGADQ